jgi:hypothetical protein
MKKAILVFVISSSVGCASGPTACECLDAYQYKGVNVATFKEDMKKHVDVRKCQDKFGGGLDQYRGTQKYSDEMIKVLKQKCNDQ